MRAGHIIFGVDDLAKAVKKWEDKGFCVEYGTKSKKRNALIYFSEGPYIELLSVANIPKFARWFFGLLGAKPFMDRIDYFCESDLINKDIASFCIEKDPGDLLREINSDGNYFFQRH